VCEEGIGRQAHGLLQALSGGRQEVGAKFALAAGGLGHITSEA
jgi:hypothetical protein